MPTFQKLLDHIGACSPIGLGPLMRDLGIADEKRDAFWSLLREVSAKDVIVINSNALMCSRMSENPPDVNARADAARIDRGAKLRI
jgi:hypothetical protein